MEFFKIDGSHGEGGGQILRSAITLSCITKIPIKIENIRHKRKNPGLRAQHLTAIKILSRICNAKVVGLKIGSTEIEFIPNEIQDMEINEDVGTAGSISLILQVLIYAVSLSKKNLKLVIKGGTDVLWSPTINYTRFVLTDALSRFGITYSINVKKRGYFPKGGGIVEVEVFPCKKITNISLTNRTTNNANLYCSYSNLNKKMIQTEVTKIEKKFTEKGWKLDVKILEEESVESGATLVICSKDENSVFGIDGLWDQHTKTFKNLFYEKILENNLGVDENLADMLVVPASQSNEISVFTVNKITKHLETNLYVTSKITGCKYGIGKITNGYEVRIKGEL